MTQSIVVQPYDWVVKDKFGDDGSLVIHCWALDRESRPNLLRIINFPVTCYIELPMFIRNHEFSWTDEAATVIMTEVCNVLGSNAPFAFSYVEKRKLYYYRNRTYPMVLAQFRSLSAMLKCKDLFTKPLHVNDFGHVACKVHETDITVLRKLLTARRIGYSQWFSAKVEPVNEDDRISTLQYEYIVRWDNLYQAPDICTTWITNPAILAFDIECYSSNHRAMPNKYDIGHVAYMISCIYQRHKDPKSRKRYGIIIGDCATIPEERLENYTAITVNSEYQLIEAFAKVIKDTDPDIITGYNILGFDYPYLDHRVKRQIKPWPVMGRIIAQETVITKKEWASDAYGFNSINILHMEGRISVDLYPIIKRGHKLPKYDLNTVASRFIGRTKFDIKASEMFTIYEQLKQALKDYNEAALSGEVPATILERLNKAKAETARVMEYCVRDSELVIDLMEVLNIWIGLVELANIVGVTIMELFTRGQQIRCLSQLYDVANDPVSKRNIVIDSRDIPFGGFSGGHVEEPVVGLHDNIICLDFTSLYPSIIQAFNICYTTLIPPERRDMSNEECHVIIAEETKTITVDTAEEKEIFDTRTSKKAAPQKVKTTKRYVDRYYKGVEGVLPALVRQLVAKRGEIKKLMAIEEKNGIPNPLYYMILNERQNALKVAANSVFGFLGIRNGKKSLEEGARDITAKGRELIATVGKMIATRYNGRTIYGDTDSCMIDLGITNIKDCQMWGEKLTQEINGVKVGDKLPGSKTEVHTVAKAGLFPAPLRMEFEKAMRLLCLKKKRYVYLPIENGEFKRVPIYKDGRKVGYSDKYDMQKKGIPLARRDNTEFLRNIYTAALEIIMTKGTLQQILIILCDAIDKLVSGKVDFKDLTSIRSLGHHYKNDNYFMKLFADRLRRVGKIVNAGDRLEFLIIEDPQEQLLGNRMYLVEEYLESLSTDKPMVIDYQYYLSNLLKNPINQLISVSYKDQIEATKPYYWFQQSSRHKPIYLDRPINILAQAYLSNMSIPQLKSCMLEWLAYIETKPAIPLTFLIEDTTESEEQTSVAFVITDDLMI